MTLSSPRLLAVLAALCAIAGCSSGGGEWQTTNITGVMPDLQFTLTDENGKTVHADDYAGKVDMVYFGFTQCPDVCPTTLATIAQALDKLDGQAQNVRVLFVSVDPHRDTPEKLADYTNAFAPQMVGLTGSMSQLEAMTKRYRVAFSYGDKYPQGQYDVYHSSAIFVFDAQGEARLLMKQGDGAEEIAADLERLVGTT